MTSTPSGTTRLQCNIPRATDQQLRHLAAQRGTSITEVVRRAVALLVLVEAHMDQAGAQVHLITRDGETIHLRLL